MSTSYLALTILVVFLILFIYFCFLSVSLRTIKSNEDESGKIALKNQKVEKWKFRNLIDPKNKKLSFLDLGNHILIFGIIVFAIFIIQNA